MSLNFGASLFPSRNESLINFNFQDVLRNNSYLTFYVGQMTSGVEDTEMIMSPIPFDSQAINFITLSGTAGTPDTEIFSHDIDVIIDNTVRMKGDAIINFTGYGNGSNSELQDIYYKLTLKKYDGTTETEIASSTTIPYNITTGEVRPRYAVKINIPTKVKFVKGDTIRLTIEGYADSTDATDSIGYYFDPTSRYIYGTYSYTTTTTTVINPTTNDVTSYSNYKTTGTRTDFVVNLPFEVQK